MTSRVGVLLALILTVAGCDRPPQHLLLVTLDTHRADRLGAYGYERPTSPSFDALSRQGVRFTDAISQAISTPPSHASIFTGLNPPRHGLRRLFGQALGPDNVTLGEVLAAGGFTTAAFVGGIPLKRESGLDQGFETYDDQFAGGQRSAMVTNERVATWLQGRPPGRLFLWVHYFDPHQPYTADPETRRRFSGAPAAREVQWRNANSLTGHAVPHLPQQARLGSDLYDAEIAYTDRALGDLLDMMKADDLLEDTLIVVVADHGECLGEHGYFFGHWDVYEETARVPMLLVDPAGRWKGSAIETTVRTVDLLPTILSLLGLSVPEGLDGVSLVPLLADDDREPRYAYTEQLEYFPVRSMRRGPWLLVERGDGAADRKWFRRDPDTGDIAEVDPPAGEIAMVRELRGVARPQESIPPTATKVPRQTAEQLRALGYVE